MRAPVDMIQSDDPTIAPVKSARTSYRDSGIGLCGRGRRNRKSIVGGFLRRRTAKLLAVENARKHVASPGCRPRRMNRREELNRHLAILAVTAPGAALVWWIFHGVYVNLSESAKAVGYVEPMTQAGIDFGYLVMICGTLFLAIVAARSAFALIRLLLRRAP